MRHHSRLLPLLLTAVLLVSTLPVPPLRAQGPTEPPVVDVPSVDSPPPEALDVAPPPYVAAPALVIQAQVAPDPLIVGMTATVTLVVSNQVSDPADDLVVTLPVPAGTEALPDAALVSPTEGWRWNLGHLDGNQRATVTATLRLTALPPGEALLVRPQATARDVLEPATATVGALITLRPQDLRSTRTPRATVQPQLGGVLESRDRRVRVTIPRGASDSVLQVRHRTLAEKLPELQATGAIIPPPYAGIRRGFETFFLEASDSAGRDVHQFKAPLTISVDYTPEQLLARGITEGDLTIFWFDETREVALPDGRVVRGQWIPLLTTVDPLQQVASARVDHFTPFQLSSGLSASAAFVPSLQGWQASLYTGGASYSYPMATPRGAGNQAPDLTLAYSSDSVDGSTGSRKGSQASWVGRGWNFEPGGSISRIKSTVSISSPANLMYDSFTVSVAGRSFDLVRLGPVAGSPGSQDLDQWVWAVADESFVRVRAEQSGTAGYFQWKLWTRDGTRYEFTQALRWGWKANVSISAAYFETYKWLLTAVVDPSGNKITYAYQVQTHGTAPNIAHPTYYLQSISWGYDGATPGTGNPRYTAEMEVVARSASLSGTVDGAWEWAENQYYATTTSGPDAPHEAWRLESVSIKSKATTASSFALVRKYDLVYELASASLQTDFTPSSSTDWQRVLTLKSVQVVGNNGTSALPATTFAYGTSRGTATEPNPGWNRLTSVDNGYGGKVTFSYQHIWTSAQKPYVMGGPWAFRFRVSQALVESGPSGQSYRTDTLTTYAYEEPALNERAYSAMVWYAAFPPPSGGNATDFLTHRELSEFRGHAAVTVKTYDGATTATPLLAQTKHWFYQGDAEPACTPPLVSGGVDINSTCFQAMLKSEGWRGRAYKVEEQSGAGAVLRRTTNTFTRIELPFYQSNLQGEYRRAGLWRAFNPQTQTVVDLLEGGTSASRRTTTYTYNLSATAEGGQYGNLLTVEERDQNNAIVRTTAYSYATRDDTSAYIVDRVWQELTRDGANGVVSLAHTFYDSQNTTAKALGTRGLTTRTLGYANLNNATTLAGTYQGQDTVTTYDLWGNPLTTTTYAGYGSGTVSGSSWSYSAPGGGSTARTTTTTYNDNSLRVFPTQITYPTVGSVTLSEQAGYDFRMGTLTSVTDANGVVTSATYDVFGRLDTLIKPGDSSTTPTEDTDYYDTEKPFRVLVKQRETAGNSAVRPVQRFYDGLGRLIQEKTESLDVTSTAGQNIITDTRYNGLGLVSQAAQARYGSENSATTFYKYTPTPGSGVNWTTTVYDLLQRPITVTAPDTTITSYSYAIDVALLMAAAQTVNANSHKTRHIMDSLGRLRKAEEYSGTSPSWTLYAATTYQYDAHDRLASVTDQKGNLTAVGYDSLGRKGTLLDPDMGSWSYLYDPNGNLTRQTDSRGQRICFFYDALNRLTGKQHNGTSDTCPASSTTSTYSYDAFVSGSNFGKGRQTGMASSDHTVAWKYNARGQVSEASHTVAGVTRVFSWAYDSADRLRTLTYPAIGANPAEQVTYTYDAGWRSTSVCAGATCYVKSAATWTALGQPDTWTLGNNLIQDWTYASPMQRLQRLTVGSSGLFDRAYTYDNVENVRSVADAIASQTYNYRYDHRDRLTRAWITPGTTPAAGQALLAEPETLLQAQPEVMPESEPAAVTTDTTLVEAVSGALNRGNVFGQLPLTFTPNVGQVDPTVQYLARGPSSQLFFTSEEIVLAIATQKDPTVDQKDKRPGKDKLKSKEKAAIGVVRIQFDGANPTPSITATERLAATVNYIKGDDPARWQLDVPTFSGVTYQRLYPGIDLVYTGSDGRLKGTYHVAANTDPGQIRWRYQGAERTRLGPTGDLRITVPVTYTEATSSTGVVTKTRKLEVVEQAPVAWQEIDGAQVVVPAQFTVEADGRVGFALGSYDPNLPVIIDPVLTYSTYLGGSGGETSPAIAVDSSGNIYLTGQTSSTDFPTASAYDPTANGSWDIFVSKINATGTALLYSTYLGGSVADAANDIAVDSAGNASIAGYTESNNFPQLAALTNTWGTDAQNAILARLNGTGGLVFSTYLGGTGRDSASGIALDSSNAMYVAGSTRAFNFPVLNAMQATKGDGSAASTDGFVTKLTWNGSALSYAFSTYIGGNDSDEATAIGVDSTGSTYIAGNTYSTTFPTVAAYDNTLNATPDVFVAKFSTAGSSLIYSTFLGGASSDLAYGLAVDASGSAYVAGYTASADYPTTSANRIDGTLGSYADGFVTKLTWSGSALSLGYSTYLGGNDGDGAYDIAVDNTGSATVIGYTYATDFPTFKPSQAALASAGSPDAFVSKLLPSGAAFDYSTYLGGTGYDSGETIAIDAAGNAYAAGQTYSSNFPTAAPLDSTRGGTDDIFVAKLANLPDDSFTYDELGNLTNKGGTSYTYGANGNATGAGPHQARSIGGQTYSYDSAGNLLSGGGRSYTWNAESRLTQVTQGSVTETYGYSGAGDRVKKVTGSVTTIYLEGLWEETLGTGASVKTTYSFGGLPVAVRNSSGGTLTYLHGDHLGSLSVATSSSGGLVNRQEFDPWGAVRSGSLPQTSQNFTGQRLDATGLLYYNARYYDPTIGRFLSADTIVPGAGALTTWPSDLVASKAWGTTGSGPANPQELNRYSYALNNPVRNTDPTGHFAWILGAAAIGAVTNALIYAGTQIVTGQDITLGGVLSAGVSGAATGALMAVGGPLIGTAIRAVGISAISTGVGAKVVEGVAAGVASIGVSIAADWVAGSVVEPLGNAAQTWFTGTAPSTSGPDWEKAAAGGLASAPLLIDTEDTWTAMRSSMRQPTPPRYRWDRVAWRNYNARLLTRSGNWRAMAINTVIGVALSAAGSNTWGTVRASYQRQQGPR